MDILYVIAVCVVIGLILWLVNKFVPMGGQVKEFMNAAVIVLLVLWLLFGLIGHVETPHVFIR